MMLNTELVEKVQSYLTMNKIKAEKKDMEMICFSLQSVMKVCKFSFEEAVKDIVEDYFKIPAEKNLEGMVSDHGRKEQKQYIFEDYVLQGIPNAFNDKTSYWLSKRNLTVATYCFSARTEREVQYHLKHIDGYIRHFKNAYEKNSDSVSCLDFIKNKFGSCMIPEHLYTE